MDKALVLYRKQDWENAKSSYLAILKIDKRHYPALVNLGAICRQLNQVADAKKYYLRAIDQSPQAKEAWFNYGNLCLASSDFSESQRAFLQVVALDNDNLPAHYQLAVCYRQQQSWPLCKDSLERVLQLDELNENALLELGNCWQHLGDRTQALTQYLSLLQHYPNSWKAHYSLARWYDAEGQHALGADYLAKAIAENGPAQQLHLSLAQARFDMGNYAGAKEKYQDVLSLNGAHASALIGLGACLMHLQQEDQAEEIFQQVSASENIKELSELARVIWEYKFFQQAIRVLKKIVRLRPDLADTHLNLGKAYYQNWQMSAARACFLQALEKSPNLLAAQDLLGDLYARQGQSELSLPLYQARIDREGANSSSISSYLFTELYCSTVTAKEKLAHHIALTDRWPRAKAQPFAPKKIDAKTLRVGFVSADFRDQHPVGIFIQAVFGHYNKDKFHFTGYYTSRTYDDSTYEIKAKLDNWVDVGEWSDQRLQRQIINDGIDILIDLSGHTAKHRLRMFALRAAPVQMTWLGYPHSTGLAEMDYLIADSIVCPEKNDKLCVEKVLRLPEHCVFCFPPEQNFAEIDNDLSYIRDGLSEGVAGGEAQGIVFGSFNNLTKVNSATLDLWLSVLLAVPNSRLKLKTPSFTDEECRQEFIKHFVDRGIAVHRLIFTGPSSLEDMMAEYNQVDIALDTIPYNGGTTTFQALWMGVPVLTLEGDNFCGRMGASIMSHLGLPDWVAKSAGEFVEKAVFFAQPENGLFALKQGLRRQMIESPLCDAHGFTRSFEEQLQSAWHARPKP